MNSYMYSKYLTGGKDPGKPLGRVYVLKVLLTAGWSFLPCI